MSLEYLAWIRELVESAVDIRVLVRPRPVEIDMSFFHNTWKEIVAEKCKKHLETFGSCRLNDERTYCCMFIMKEDGEEKLWDCEAMAKERRYDRPDRYSDRRHL